MEKRKDLSNSTRPGKEENLIWNHVMDSFLIDALVHQLEIGNRVGGTFTSYAYDNIVKELSERFSGKKFDKERIKNRIKYIKKGFGPCYDIFKKGLSGFSWDPVRSLWCAEPEVWDKLVEAHPNAALWRNKPVYNYEKLVLLYGTDRATGDDAETAAEMREREKNLQDQNQNNTIEEIDRMVFSNEVRLEDYSTLQNENSPQLKQSEGGTSNKRAKKREVKEDEISILKESFHKIADAILKSTAEFVKSQPMGPIAKSEVHNMLVELGFEGSERNKAYIFLIKHPDMLDGFLGCPPDERKDLLLQMMSFN